MSLFLNYTFWWQIIEGGDNCHPSAAPPPAVPMTMFVRRGSVAQQRADNAFGVHGLLLVKS